MITNEKNNITRRAAQQTYDRARGNLLLMIIFTVVNIILLVLQSNTMLLFSATVPYMSLIIGIASEMNIVLMVGIALSSITVILYLLCWIFSRKHVAWMIVSLVMFVIDTIALVGTYLILQDFSGILDLLVHIWVLYYLVLGVRYGFILKKLPEETECDEESETDATENSFSRDINTPILYRADTMCKHRVLLETNELGYRICYRRVKRTNELVINDYVYDSREMLFETPHMLVARLDGHLFQVGYDGLHSYICIDGEKIAKKFRIW